MTQELYLGITNRNPCPNRRAQRLICQKEAFPQMFLIFLVCVKLTRLTSTRRDASAVTTTHWLLLPRRFPEPTLGSSQLPVTPVPGHLMPLLASSATCTQYTHAHNWKYKINKESVSLVGSGMAFLQVVP